MIPIDVKIWARYLPIVDVDMISSPSEIHVHVCSKNIVDSFITKSLYILAFSENTAEDNLLRHLFGDYNIHARPVREPSESLGVSFGVVMKQIIDLVGPWYWAIWLLWDNPTVNVGTNVLSDPWNLFWAHFDQHS